MNVGRRSVWPRPWQPLLAALLGIALMLWLAWPGFYSSDSVVQFAQARRLLPLSDEHPPLMALAWRALDHLWPDFLPPRAGALFALLVVGYWSALAALVWRLFDGNARRWLIFALIGLWPPAFIIICHVWKNGLAVAALLAACAAIVAWRRFGRRSGFVFALLWLIVAACLRHNGIFAAAPLALWLAWPCGASIARDAPIRLPPVAQRTGAITIAICLAMAIAPPLVARVTHAHAGHAWTIGVVWDLAGMSVRENRVLIPQDMVIGTLSIEDLRHGYVPYAAPALFDMGKIRLSFEDNFSDADLSALRSAWLHAIWNYPGAYLQHRLAYARYQFLGYPRDAIRDPTFSPMRLQLAQIPMQLPPVDTNSPWLRMLEWLRPTPLFAGALYVAFAFIAAWIAWRRRLGRDPLPVFALSASALANALPLAIIGPSAEFRYMIWSVLASLLALALALQPGERVLRTPHMLCLSDHDRLRACSGLDPGMSGAQDDREATVAP